MSGHRWSGWPGAWCLDCGAEDLIEIAIGEGYYDPYSGAWADGVSPADYDVGACPCPGEGRADPYRAAANMPPDAAAEGGEG